MHSRCWMLLLLLLCDKWAALEVIIHSSIRMQIMLPIHPATHPPSSSGPVMRATASSSIEIINLASFMGDGRFTSFFLISRFFSFRKEINGYYD
uniref:Putative secreted protein n=1 Tax=Anopheles marajoara TaxID=58244 RepID=A0A2M4CA17_9DIPT